MSANPIINRTANPTENPNVVERYFRAVVARPWTVIALSAVFVFASGAFLPSMVMDTRSDAFIDVDEPAFRVAKCAQRPSASTSADASALGRHATIRRFDVRVDSIECIFAGGLECVLGGSQSTGLAHPN